MVTKSLPSPELHKTELALLDLYSGCGGMSIGLCLGANISSVNLITFKHPLLPIVGLLVVLLKQRDILYLVLFALACAIFSSTELQDILPNIIHQLDNLENLKKLAEQFQKQVLVQPQHKKRMMMMFQSLFVLCF